jgi:predicted nucleic acid-binding protein
MTLLDSSVISALMLERPDRVVADWLDRQPYPSIWTSSIAAFEIRFGLHAMPAGKRQTDRIAAFERILTDVIEERIVPFDSAAAKCAAYLMAERKHRGRPGELRDTMIAGIVLASHATLATRNVKHFEDIASSVVNPWDRD